MHSRPYLFWPFQFTATHWLAELLVNSSSSETERIICRFKQVPGAPCTEATTGTGSQPTSPDASERAQD